jgi:hypothetical protein
MDSLFSMPTRKWISLKHRPPQLTSAMTLTIASASLVSCRHIGASLGRHRSSAVVDLSQLPVMVVEMNVSMETVMTL